MESSSRPFSPHPLVGDLALLRRFMPQRTSLPSRRALTRSPSAPSHLRDRIASASLLQERWSLLAALLLWVLPWQAEAVRPFVTDDAEVVGKRQFQLEMWFELDRYQLDHNLMLAFGPTTWLELSAGFIQALDWESRYGITGPILQAKAALWELPEDGWSLAFAAGALPPLGLGPLESEGWGSFAYAAFTQSISGGDLLVHANLGAAAIDRARGLKVAPTAGLGAQALLFGPLYGLGEIFYADPYDPDAKTGAQGGLRYIVSEFIQFDAAGGAKVVGAGDRPVAWLTLGIRLVSPPL